MGPPLRKSPRMGNLLRANLQSPSNHGFHAHPHHLLLLAAKYDRLKLQSACSVDHLHTPRRRLTFSSRRSILETRGRGRCACEHIPSLLLLLWLHACSRMPRASYCVLLPSPAPFLKSYTAMWMTRLILRRRRARLDQKSSSRCLAS